MRGCGCIVRPAFPAPSDDRGRIYQENSGETGRENNFVMPGLDPGIHQSSLNDFFKMDHRVKPGDDDLETGKRAWLFDMKTEDARREA
jgi:hypothetical protein